MLKITILGPLLFLLCSTLNGCATYIQQSVDHDLVTENSLDLNGIKVSINNRSRENSLTRGTVFTVVLSANQSNKTSFKDAMRRANSPTREQLINRFKAGSVEEVVESYIESPTRPDLIMNKDKDFISQVHASPVYMGTLYEAYLHHRIQQLGGSIVATGAEDFKLDLRYDYKIGKPRGDSYSNLCKQEGSALMALQIPVQTLSLGLIPVPNFKQCRVEITVTDQEGELTGQVVREESITQIFQIYGLFGDWFNIQKDQEKAEAHLMINDINTMLISLKDSYAFD